MNKTFADAVKDEAGLRAALAEADIGPTLMVLAQLTGDMTLLEEVGPHIRGAWDYQQTVPEDLKQKVRDRLVDVLKDYAASGRRPSTDLPPKTFQRIMSGGAGSQVPDEYMPLVMEEMKFGTRDTREVAWRRDRDALPLSDFKVVIVGAGLSGICAGIHLKQAGIPFVILEKNGMPGGTWFENDYPGSGVDIPNYFYSFSFFTDYAWTRHFSKRDELLAYLQAAIDRSGIRDAIRLNVEVTQATWDEPARRWRIDYREASGRPGTLSGNAMLSAVGQLNRPSVPTIPGLQDFQGPCFHTARWRKDVDLRHKRVVMIGTGASGMQVAPTIAPLVEKLTIVQRTPHWAFHHPNYHRDISPGLRWALQHIPFYAQWYRFSLFWAASDGLHPSLRVDPEWREPGSVSALNKELRERIEAHIRSEVGDDPALLAKVLPDYAPYSKRMLRDNHWYRMLKQPHVELTTGRVDRVTADAVIMAGGSVHPADVLVLATGFEAGRMLAPMEVRGKSGLDIRAVWGDDNPRAYLGITAPGFPNLFFAYGPNTNLVHGGSIFFQAECQVHYMMEALRELIEGGHGALEVRPEVHDEYNERVDAACRKLAWGQVTVKNWYQNKDRRVFANSPWRLIDYWRMTHRFEPSDYVFLPARSPATSGSA